MPEINIEIMAQFDSRDLRDLAFRYLDHQGSVFEDDLPEDQRELWQLLQNDLPAADTVVTVGQQAIRLEYAPVDDELDAEGNLVLAEDVEERIYEHLFRAGMINAYVLVDVEGQYHAQLLTPPALGSPDLWHTEVLYDDGDYDGTPTSDWPEALARASESNDEDLLSLVIAIHEQETGCASSKPR